MAEHEVNTEGGYAEDGPCECLITDPPGPTHGRLCSMYEPETPA
ncbi:hypothetical protein SAMN05428985_11045 [Nocardioides sp. YR527]|nr:hypothetical protein [Nocardioides sp. YR527]SDL14602.1 hypothetical protein SAMN05428985_11045 [Nocardioides sp. YR527]